MKIREFEKTIIFEEPIDTVFSFFCRAENLQRITPPWVHFRILTPLPIEMQLGTMIDYQLKLHGIPVKWRTEITAWQPPYFFEDTQLRGPYRQWIHKHSFEEHDGGTLMRDRVDYAAPGWFMEPLINRFLIGPNVEQIFSYRQQCFSDLFSIREDAPSAA